MSDNEKSIESSGNVFEDLGFDKGQAATMLLRARMMLNVTRQLRTLGKTQIELAEILGIGQSRVSELMKGKAKLFSLDMLLSLAQRLGMHVTVEVGPRRPLQSGRHVVAPSTTEERVRRMSWGTATGVVVNVVARQESVGVAPARIHSSDAAVGLGTYRLQHAASTDDLREHIRLAA